MPELPEVETLRKGLEKYIVGHTIVSVECIRSKQFAGDPKKIERAKIVSVERFGKGLVINLDNDYSLAIHIKLTGQLIYRNNESIMNQAGREDVPNKFTHIIFHLDRGANLFYNDQRQFGWIKVVKTEDVQKLSFFKELGPEFPLLPGKEKLTFEKFQELLSKTKMPIKPLLLEQKKIAGIGNIYANDGLYVAKIDPRRPANSLTEKEKDALFKAILTVMQKGLETGGASELTFVNVLGEKGQYQDHSLVYGHTGEKCNRDGGIIKKFMLAGRGTYMCSKCQK